MTTNPNFLREIDAALGSATNSNYSTASAVNDLFEGYVFSLVLNAARVEGADVYFETNSENLTTNLIFRTSPGAIYSSHAPYTHAVLDFPNCPELEAHIGVYVSGKSEVLHECDVVVLQRYEAQLCRYGQGHPRYHKVVLAAECKFHSGTLNLGHARNFLGLTREIKTENRFLVTNTSSPKAAKLVQHHNGEWEFNLDLSEPKIAADLSARFSRVFRNYKIENA